MTMSTYHSLSDSLHGVADAVKVYLSEQMGATKIQIETAVEELAFITPLTGSLPDFHYICVEVTDSPLRDALEANFVQEGIRRFLPIRLFVAVPKGIVDGVFRQVEAKTRRHGLGLLEVDGARVTPIHQALSLSLAGVRSCDLTLVPRRYRHALTSAEQAFKNGTPVEGCKKVYEEIEAFSRRLAKATLHKGLWMGEGRPPRFFRDNWATVMQAWERRIDAQQTRRVCPKLTTVFIARIVGSTPYRNLTAHKPNTRAELVERDKQLRTRFEDACDLFGALVEAAKPLRIR